MKQRATSGYTFAPASGTLDLSAIAGMSVGGLDAVINKTTGNQLIYAAAAGTGLGGTFAGLVLTPATSLAGMSPSDKLSIIYDDGATLAQDASLGTDGTSPPALPGGATGVRGWLRYLGVQLSNLTTVLTGTLSVGGVVAVSNLPGTQAVSGALTANAGTNLNTSALALKAGGNLAAISTKTPALGPAGKAAAVPVTMATDQPAIAVSASALPLPAGAALEAGNLATLAGAVAGGSVTVTSRNGRSKTMTVVTVPGYAAGGTSAATPNNGSATNTAVAANTPVQLLPANAARRSLEIVNIGTQLAHFGHAAALAPGQGWPLSAADTSGDTGGGYTSDAPHTGAIYAASAAGTTLVVMEG